MECGAAKSGQAILASRALMASAAVMAADQAISHVDAYRVARTTECGNKLAAAKSATASWNLPTEPRARLTVIAPPKLSTFITHLHLEGTQP